MNPELERKMNEAFAYVAKNLELSGHNSKPVLFHSFKVGMTLYNNNYNEDIVISGILHDLLEDTDVTKEDLKEKYNDYIASLVEAVSFNPDIKDRFLQAKEMFLKAQDFGYPALIIKCADLLDNINYYSLANKEIQDYLLKKYKLFLDMTKEELKEERIYQELNDKFLKLNK